MNRFLAILASFLWLGVMNGSYDNYHNYRAGFFFGEPRFEKNFLTTMVVSTAAGSTTKGRDAQGHTVPLFGIYKPFLNENMQDSVYTLHGRLSLVETDFTIIQNGMFGFFAQVYLPIRRFSIYTNFDSNRQVVHRSAIHQTMVGDTTVLVGWAHSYQDTRILDFIDTTIKLGVIVPASPVQNILLHLITQYDGYKGFPISADISIGAFEWFTAGLHAGVIPFLNKNSGFITTKHDDHCLPSQLVCQQPQHRDLMWNVGAFVKIDHIAQHLSWWISYSYVNQNASSKHIQSVTDATCCPLLGWRMHTIGILGEYDFADEYNSYGPRIGFLVNTQVAGRNIIKTNMSGGYVGFDVGWQW